MMEKSEERKYVQPIKEAKRRRKERMHLKEVEVASELELRRHKVSA